MMGKLIADYSRSTHVEDHSTLSFWIHVMVVSPRRRRGTAPWPWSLVKILDPRHGDVAS